jgi:ectoine hydroxylase-related dioxygenase (phytanoyl-CoA dioxygenase family)
MPLTNDVIEQWRKEGVVCLRGVFSADWLSVLEDGFEQSFNSPSRLSKDYAKEGEGSFFTDHAMHRRVEPIHRFVNQSPLGEVAAALMSASKVNLVDDHLLVKEPGTQNPTYWHQDQPYFNFNGEDFCSLWIPLDPVDEENGTMRFVRGSHLWGKQFHPVRIGVGDTVDAAENFDGAAPDIDADPAAYDTVSWDLVPGDCFAFHGKMLHGAFANLSLDARRRALSLRLTGDDIVWAPKSYAPTESNLPELTPGGPIACADYPTVWPR